MLEFFLHQAHVAVVSTTPLIVGGAVLAFALSVIAHWRESVSARPHGSWFQQLRSAHKCVAIIVALLFTLWGGAKPDGWGRGDNGNGMDPAPIEQPEMPRSGGMNDIALSTLCFTSVSFASNDCVNLSVTWPTGLLSDGDTLDLFAKTESMTNSWRWICAAGLSQGETNLVMSVSLSELADGTNAPSRAFFHVRDRESCNRTMADRDGDSIPDVYEVRNGTNPYVPDDELAPRLTVGASGEYASIPEALAASTSYSIISLAPEVFVAGSPIVMPSHPVLLACDCGYAVIRSSAEIGAFLFDGGRGAHTLIRGLYVVLAARTSFQAAFWCGGNLPWSGDASAPSFERIRIRAPYPEPTYYGWHFYRYAPETASIRRCTINAAGATSIIGVYSYDGPPLNIGDYTAVNFPRDAALYLQTSAANYGGMTEAASVDVIGLALDQSFTNAYPFARFEAGTNFVVSLCNAIMPELPEAPHVPDFTENVCITNAGLPWNGIALPGSASYDLGIGNVEEQDFSQTIDTDGDGLSDYDEVYVHETDPWLADSDGDGMYDGVEIEGGSSPTDQYSRCRQLMVVSRRSLVPEAVTNYLSWGFAETAWLTNDWVAITSATSTVTRGFAMSGGSIYASEFSDLNCNGQFDEGSDMLITASFEEGASFCNATFDFDGDMDLDGMLDIWEAYHAGAGLSHTNAADAALDPDGDGLINLHEYLWGLNPCAVDGTNTVFSVASRSIDERIVGKTASSALPIFSNYPLCETNLVRNADCWLYGIDLSCSSPWNNMSNGGCRKTGTLISPRHIIYAYHYTMQNNRQLYFVGTNGIVYANTMVSCQRVGSTDICIGLLANETTNVCTVAKILPENYVNYLPSVKMLPVFSLDQEEKATVHEMTDLGSSATFSAPMAGTQRHDFYEQIVNYDSSNPSFILLGEQPILLCTFAGADNGPSPVHNKDAIQSTMDALAPGYSLQEVDLSRFDLFQ